MKIVFIAAMSFILMGCPDPDECCDSTITFINNSQNDVIPWEAYSDVDTTISFVLPQNAEVVMAESELRVDGNFINTMQNGVTMRLFIFPKDTVDQVTWSLIRDEYLVLRRYDLTLEDLEAMDWVIEYP